MSIGETCMYKKQAFCREFSFNFQLWKRYEINCNFISKYILEGYYETRFFCAWKLT